MLQSPLRDHGSFSFCRAKQWRSWLILPHRFLRGQLEILEVCVCSLGNGVHVFGECLSLSLPRLPSCSAAPAASSQHPPLERQIWCAPSRILVCLITRAVVSSVCRQMVFELRPVYQVRGEMAPTSLHRSFQSRHAVSVKEFDKARPQAAG